MSAAEGLLLEVNRARLPDEPVLASEDGAVVVPMTPVIDEDYWLFRVRVTENQAIVAFPKFMTIGIGFQHETDWNTNLPASSSAADILDHIRDNKGEEIPDERCLAAIEMLRAAAARHLLARAQGV